MKKAKNTLDLLLRKISNKSIRSSIYRAFIYTCGHIIIAATCNRIITNASFELATIDAIVEPVINGIWFFTLDRFWSRR
jgi:uncharacterized membrane protein